MEELPPFETPAPEPARPRRPSGSVARLEAADFVRRLHEATPHAWVTTAIVAVNALVFGLMAATGVSLLTPDVEDLLRWGADYGPSTTSGEWWRLLTCAFVHIGVLHIAMNMWALWQSGRMVERFYGNMPFLALYLSCALGGSVTSVCWNPVIVSAGASGAIFGVYGGLLAVVALQRGTIPATIFQGLRKSTLGFVTYNVLFGMTVPGIDNAAHLGGLATGFLFGWCLRAPLPGVQAAPGPRLMRAWPLVIVLVAATTAAKFRAAGTAEVRAARRFDVAVEALVAGDPDTALREIESALEMNPDDPGALSLRGDARWAKGDREGAIADYERALGIASEYAYPRMRRAWAWQDQGDLEEAIAEFTAAIRLDPEGESALLGRGWTQVQSGKTEEGLADLERALQIEPDWDVAHLHHAHALYNLERYPAALREFQELAGTDSSLASRAFFYVWVLRARMGELEAASQELKSRFSGAGPDDPLAEIAAYLLDERDAEDLLARVVSRDTRSTNGQPLELCDAWFFVGMKNLVLGSREEALHALRRSLASQAMDALTWSSAAAEVAALER